MEKKHGLIRCFIALEMLDEVIKEVARVQEVFGGWKFTGKMTELENLHLTLKFLGEIEEEKVEKVREALKKIEFKEFEAKLGVIGSFGYRGMPRIVWLKIGEKGVFELQKKIDDAMEKCGFKKEDRFMSHMTIARVRYVKDAKGFFEYVNGICVREMKWKVKDFVLKKSELWESGPVYSDVERFGLIS